MPILGIWASQISGRLWAPQGAYDALATVTVPSGGLASVTFAGIPTGYKHLQIRSMARTTSGTYDTALFYRFNGDATASNYFSRHILFGNGSSAGSTGNSGTGFTGSLVGSTSGGATLANVFAPTIVDILDYQNVSKNKTIRALTATEDNNSGTVVLASSLWLNTSAINSISIVTYDGSNFAANTQFALYGIR